MKRFKRILVVADDTEAQRALLERAVSLARRNEARLTVAAVVEGLPREAQMLAIPFAGEDLVRVFAEERGKQLEELVASIRRKKMQAATKLLTGTPFLEIIREVLRGGHDLVMISAQEAGGLKEFFFASTTLHLLRKCPCPVWALKPTRRKRYARILAAVDPGPLDAEEKTLNTTILDLAVSLAKLEKSDLHILHAWEIYSDPRVMSHRLGIARHDVDRLVRETGKAHRDWLDALLQRYVLRKIKHQVHLVQGNAAAVIAGTARREHVDLIVMGTVMRTGVAGLFIGSTAEKVLRQVNCSVLAVKPEGFVSPVKLEE